jgi:hypothetical protein
MRTLNV